MFFIDDQGILRCRAFRDLPWLEHGFQTRVSTHLPQGFTHATLRQIHSAHVVEVNGEEGLRGEGDALVSRFPGSLLSIRTADCVPALLVDPANRAIAAVHAGWRGVVAGVLPAAISRMEAAFGSRPADLLVAIGPCIRKDSFEVGPEVAVQFQPLFPERNDLDRRTTVDLAEGVRRQLRDAGVPQANIFDSGHCSFSESASFHSFRRDREASGRMSAFIGIRRVSP